MKCHKKIFCFISTDSKKLNSCKNFFPLGIFQIYWENHCIMKRIPLTTKIWHQTNIVIPFGCKINSFSTICISKEDLVGIWQKYKVAIVNNHKNAQKPHLLHKISEINLKLLTLFSERWTFCIRVWWKLGSRCKYILYSSSLTVAVWIE